MSFDSFTYHIESIECIFLIYSRGWPLHQRYFFYSSSRSPWKEKDYAHLTDLSGFVATLPIYFRFDQAGPASQFKLYNWIIKRKGERGKKRPIQRQRIDSGWRHRLFVTSRNKIYFKKTIKWIRVYAVLYNLRNTIACPLYFFRDMTTQNPARWRPHLKTFHPPLYHLYICILEGIV